MMSKDEEQKDKEGRIVHITWWRQAGEHSRIYPYIDLDVLVEGGWNAIYRTIRLWERSAEHSKMSAVLALMEGRRDNDACCSYALELDEVLSIMGWDKLPVSKYQNTINIGKER